MSWHYFYIDEINAWMFAINLELRISWQAQYSKGTLLIPCILNIILNSEIQVREFTEHGPIEELPRRFS